MQTLETWKRVQKKNEKRRAIGKRRVAHRRLIKQIPMEERVNRIMQRENERLSKLNPNKSATPKKQGLFNNIMKLFSKRSQRGS